MKTIFLRHFYTVLALCLLAGCVANGGAREAPPVDGSESGTAVTTSLRTYTDAPDVPLNTDDCPGAFPAGFKPPAGSPLMRLERGYYFASENEGWLAVPYEYFTPAQSAS